MAGGPVIPKMRSMSRRVRNRIRRDVLRLDLWVMRLFNRLPRLEIDLSSQPPQVQAPILEDICLPPHFGPTDHDDFLPLMHIAALLRPTTVVELGTAHGNTVANICRQCPDATVYTVNALTDQQSGTIVTYALTRDEIGRVYQAHGFGDRVVQIFENTLSLDLSRYLPGPVVDLAIIDACHDTDYVINDFLKVKPFIRPEGVVLLHDTHPSMKGHLAGSYIACMMLRRRGYDIRHIKNTWWALWANTDNVAKSLAGKYGGE